MRSAPDFALQISDRKIEYMQNKTGKKHSVIRRILLLAVSVYLLYSLGDLQFELMESRREYNAYNEQKQIITQEIETYKRLLEDGTEAEIIEKAASELLGYVYAGDVVYMDPN